MRPHAPPTCGGPRPTSPPTPGRLPLWDPGSLAGTVATDVFELVSLTTTPPAGAGPVSVTVPVELAPPLRAEGLSVSDESLGGGAGVTVSVAVRLTLPAEAVRTTGVDVATAAVVTGNDAEVAPAVTVTLGWTPTTAGLPLARVTVSPLPVAALLSVTTPVEA